MVVDMHSLSTCLYAAQAAAAAAERRAKDDVGCGCGAKASTDLTEADITALEEGRPVQDTTAGKADRLVAVSRNLEQGSLTGAQSNRASAQASPLAAAPGGTSARTVLKRPRLHGDVAQGGEPIRPCSRDHWQ